MRILGIDPGTVVVGFGCLELADTLSRDVLGIAAAAAATFDAVAARAAPAPAPATDERRSPRVPLAHRTANAVSARGRGGAVRLIEAGALRLPAKAPIEQRLRLLADLAQALFARLAPDELALEQAFFGRSVQAALRIGEARGVILAEACRHGLAVHQFAPASVKRSVAGHGAASKDAVGEMTRRLLALSDVPRPRDASDALAIALCRIEQRRTLTSALSCNSSAQSIQYAPASLERSRGCHSHTSEALEHRAGADTSGEHTGRQGPGRKPDQPRAAPSA